MVVYKPVYKSSKNAQTIIKLLPHIFQLHAEQLPQKTDRTYLTWDAMDETISYLSCESQLKLFELCLSHNSSAVYNTMQLLDSISRHFSRQGLKYFEKAFILSNPTFSTSHIKEKDIERLLSLSDGEYSWWCQLTCLHAEETGFNDFSEQIKVFDSFLKSLRELDIRIDLPTPCPIIATDHFNVAINRMLHVLQKSKKPIAQFKGVRLGNKWCSLCIREVYISIHSF